MIMSPDSKIWLITGMFHRIRPTTRKHPPPRGAPRVPTIWDAAHKAEGPRACAVVSKPSNLDFFFCKALPPDSVSRSSGGSSRAAIVSSRRHECAPLTRDDDSSPRRSRPWSTNGGEKTGSGCSSSTCRRRSRRCRGRSRRRSRCGVAWTCW